MTTEFSERSRNIIRVLIVDDSPLIIDLFKAMLADLPDIQIAGIATNGQDAIRMALRLQPDVITMDIRMPQMDGLEAIRQIMSIEPKPIVVVSSSVYAADYNTAFNAIEAGALTVIEKPTGLSDKEYDSVQHQLTNAIRTLSKAIPIHRSHKHITTPTDIGPKTAMLHSYVLNSVQAIGIAASTGGPPVLAEILSGLPAGFSIPLLIVQHNLPAFMPALAEWLSGRTKLPIKIATDGLRLENGCVYLAQGDAHLTVTPDRLLHTDQSPPVDGNRPSATRLFQSMATTFGKNSIGIVLTGMGEDGVNGLAKMAAAGAHIMVQDEDTSVVFGMPKAAIDRHIVDEVLSPPEMILRLTKLHRHLKAPHS